jgi:glycosyltransferase involved in cell wall biosynthesis
MIRHRENGLLCDPGDADGLANSVLELLEREDFARRLAHNARVWAEQLSWNNVFPRLLSCYGLAPEHAGTDVGDEILVQRV